MSLQNSSVLLNPNEKNFDKKIHEKSKLTGAVKENFKTNLIQNCSQKNLRLLKSRIPKRIPERSRIFENLTKNDFSVSKKQKSKYSCSSSNRSEKIENYLDTKVSKSAEEIQEALENQSEKNIEKNRYSENHRPKKPKVKITKYKSYTNHFVRHQTLFALNSFNFFRFFDFINPSLPIISKKVPSRNRSKAGVESPCPICLGPSEQKQSELLCTHCKNKSQRHSGSKKDREVYHCKKPKSHKTWYQKGQYKPKIFDSSETSVSFGSAEIIPKDLNRVFSKDFFEKGAKTQRNSSSESVASDLINPSFEKYDCIYLPLGSKKKIKKSICGRKIEVTQRSFTSSKNSTVSDQKELKNQKNSEEKNLSIYKKYSRTSVGTFGSQAAGEDKIYYQTENHQHRHHFSRPIDSNYRICSSNNSLRSNSSPRGKVCKKRPSKESKKRRESSFTSFCYQESEPKGSSCETLPLRKSRQKSHSKICKKSKKPKEKISTICTNQEFIETPCELKKKSCIKSTKKPKSKKSIFFKRFSKKSCNFSNKNLEEISDRKNCSIESRSTKRKQSVDSCSSRRKRSIENCSSRKKLSADYLPEICPCKNRSLASCSYRKNRSIERVSSRNSSKDRCSLRKHTSPANLSIESCSRRKTHSKDRSSNRKNRSLDKYPCRKNRSIESCRKRSLERCSSRRKHSKEHVSNRNQKHRTVESPCHKKRSVDNSIIICTQESCPHKKSRSFESHTSKKNSSIDNCIDRSLEPCSSRKNRSHSRKKSHSLESHSCKSCSRNRSAELCTHRSKRHSQNRPTSRNCLDCLTKSSSALLESNFLHQISSIDVCSKPCLDCCICPKEKKAKLKSCCKNSKSVRKKSSVVSICSESSEGSVQYNKKEYYCKKKSKKSCKSPLDICGNLPCGRSPCCRNNSGSRICDISTCRTRPCGVSRSGSQICEIGPRGTRPCESPCGYSPCGTRPCEPPCGYSPRRPRKKKSPCRKTSSRNQHYEYCPSDSVPCGASPCGRPSCDFLVPCPREISCQASLASISKEKIKKIKKSCKKIARCPSHDSIPVCVPCPRSSSTLIKKTSKSSCRYRRSSSRCRPTRFCKPGPAILCAEKNTVPCDDNSLDYICRVESVDKVCRPLSSCCRKSKKHRSSSCRKCKSKEFFKNLTGGRPKKEPRLICYKEQAPKFVTCPSRRPVSGDGSFIQKPSCWDGPGLTRRIPSCHRVDLHQSCRVEKHSKSKNPRPCRGTPNQDCYFKQPSETRIRCKPICTPSEDRICKRKSKKPRKTSKICKTRISESQRPSNLIQPQRPCTEPIPSETRVPRADICKPKHRERFLNRCFKKISQTRLPCNIRSKTEIIPCPNPEACEQKLKNKKSCSKSSLAKKCKKLCTKRSVECDCQLIRPRSEVKKTTSTNTGSPCTKYIRGKMESHMRKKNSSEEIRCCSNDTCANKNRKKLVINPLCTTTPDVYKYVFGPTLDETVIAGIYNFRKFLRRMRNQNQTVESSSNSILTDQISNDCEDCECPEPKAVKKSSKDSIPDCHKEKNPVQFRCQAGESFQEAENNSNISRIVSSTGINQESKDSNKKKHKNDVNGKSASFENCAGKEYAQKYNNNNTKEVYDCNVSLGTSRSTVGSGNTNVSYPVSDTGTEETFNSKDVGCISSFRPSEANVIEPVCEHFNKTMSELGSSKNKITPYIDVSSTNINSRNQIITQKVSDNSQKNCVPKETRFAITKILKYDDFTTYEIFKSTRAKPKVLPSKTEGIFVLQNKNMVTSDKKI